MAQIDLTRRTKIVATIGPATESPERIRELIQAGATTFRLNFSHGDHSEHAERMATIRQVAHELGAHIGILQDLQGPKIRLGRFEEGPITLAKGDQFALTAKQVRCNQTVATVTYDKLAEEVSAGSRILLDDGRVEMKVERVDAVDQTLHCSVTVPGVLSNNKGVNFPDVRTSGKFTPLLLDSTPGTVTEQWRVWSTASTRSTFISTRPSSRRMRLPADTSSASLS